MVCLKIPKKGAQRGKSLVTGGNGTTAVCFKPRKKIFNQRSVYLLKGKLLRRNTTIFIAKNQKQ